MGICILQSHHGHDIAQDLEMVFVPFDNNHGAEYLVVLWREAGVDPAFVKFIPTLEQMSL